jgi:hypothetical protein
MQTNQGEINHQVYQMAQSPYIQSQAAQLGGPHNPIESRVSFGDQEGQNPHFLPRQAANGEGKPTSGEHQQTSPNFNKELMREQKLKNFLEGIRTQESGKEQEGPKVQESVEMSNFESFRVDKEGMSSEQFYALTGSQESEDFNKQIQKGNQFYVETSLMSEAAGGDWTEQDEAEF